MTHIISEVSLFCGISRHDACLRGGSASPKCDCKCHAHFQVRVAGGLNIQNLAHTLWVTARNSPLVWTNGDLDEHLYSLVVAASSQIDLQGMTASQFHLKLQPSFQRETWDWEATAAELNGEI